MKKNNTSITNKTSGLVSFAENISVTGSNKPSDRAKEIMVLYAEGAIDLETAEKEILRLHKVI